MAEFENPYAQVDPSARVHFGRLNCGGKLWEYAIRDRMVCEDCRELFDPSETLDKSIGHE